MAIQSKVISIEEYEAMADAGTVPGDYRTELIRGVIVEKMSPNLPHIICVARLQLLFIKRFSDVTRVITQSPVRIPPNSKPEPDVTLLRWRDDFYIDKYPAAEDVLLLIEVSDSTLTDDRNVKAPLYAMGGVSEYWIVNLQEMVVEVYSDLSQGSYQSVKRAGRGETLVLPEGLAGEVTVDDILG